MKMYLLEVIWGAIYWIVVAPGRDMWRAFVNAVVNLRFP
jgi:hypothetical protein